MTPRPEALGGIGALASDRVKDPAGRGAAALRAVLDTARRQSSHPRKDLRRGRIRGGFRPTPTQPHPLSTVIPALVAGTPGSAGSEPPWRASAPHNRPCGGQRGSRHKGGNDGKIGGSHLKPQSVTPALPIRPQRRGRALTRPDARAPIHQGFKAWPIRGGWGRLRLQWPRPTR